MKKLSIVTLAVLVLISGTFFSGCKGQQEMKQQITDLEAKNADAQRRIGAVDGEVKRVSGELAQIKDLVTKLGNVVINLQKAEEDRQKAAAEAAAKAAAKKVPAKKKKR